MRERASESSTGYAASVSPRERYRRAAAAAAVRRAAGRAVEPLETRRLMAATLTPDTTDGMVMTVGDTGEFQVFFGGSEFGEVFVGADDFPVPPGPEQPGAGGLIVRLYDQTDGGAPSPGTTYGLPRVFNNDESALNYTPVDQTASADDEVTTVFAAGDLLEITQTISKPFSTEDPFVLVTNAVQNTGAAPVTVDLFAAADLSVAFAGFEDGLDRSTGESFGSRDEASGTTIAGGTSGFDDERLFFQSEPAGTSPALPAPLFEAAAFDAVWDAIQVLGTESTEAELHLDNTPTDQTTDNAAALEWRAVTIAPGATQTISYYVAYTPVFEGAGADDPPDASLQSAPDERNAAATSYRFTVDFIDDAAINSDTVGDGDVEVFATDPDNGYASNAEINGQRPQAARLISKEAITGPEGEAVVRAVYEIQGPFAAGATGPSAFAAGQYAVFVAPNAVTDSNGQPVSDVPLGTFEIGPPRLGVIPTTDTAALQQALFAGTGVTVTSATVSSRSGDNGATSVGTYAAPTGDVFDLPVGPGLVLGTGDVRQSASGSSVGDALSTEYGTAATAAEQDLLEPLAGEDGQGATFQDVTRVDLTFDAPAGLSELVFNFAFATEEGGEAPNPDVFGLYLNGQNIAFSDELGDDQVLANALFPVTSEGSESGTRLDRVLTELGRSPVARQVDVNATGNTLTLIIGDANNAALDSTAFVRATTQLPPLIDPDTVGGAANLGFVAEAVTYDGDKPLAVGWGAPDQNSLPGFVLRRQTVDNAPDPTFGGGDGQVETAITGGQGGLGGKLYDVKVANDGRIYVSGEADGRLAVARYLNDGTLDTAFAGDGIAEVELFPGTDSFGFGYALAFDGDKVVVTGSNERPIGGKFTEDLVLVRFNNDGTLDTSFVGADGTGGQIPDGVVLANLGSGFDSGARVEIRGERILVAGVAGERVVVAAFNRADGTADTAFGGQGNGQVLVRPGGADVFAPSRFVGMAVQGDGKILLGAALGTEDGDSDVAVVRLGADGAADTGFGGGDGIATADFGGFDDADEVRVNTDGTLVVGGTSESGNTGRSGVALFDAAGALIADFGTGGVLLFDPVDLDTGAPAGGPGPQDLGLVAGARKVAMATRPGSVALTNPRSDETSSVRELQVDRAAPAAAVTATTPQTFTGPSADPLRLEVTFTDATGVDVSDITPDTLSFVRQTGGATPAVTVTVAAVEPNTDAASVKATYEIRPQDGSWDAADQGTYAIGLKGGLISDTTTENGGPFVMPETALRTFAVQFDRVELGTVVGQTRRASFQLPDGGASFTVSLRGGTATVFRATTGNGVDLDLSGTTAASTVVVTTGRRTPLSLRNVVVDGGGGLRSLTARTADLSGTVTAAGIGSVQVASMTNADVRTTGSINRVTVGGNMAGSTVFAGVAPTLDELPDAAADFANRDALIGSVQVRGTFSNSRIAAPWVNTARLGTVTTANGGAVFGLSSGAFRSVQAATSPRLRLRNIDTPAESQRQGDFVVRAVALGATAGGTGIDGSLLGGGDDRDPSDRA